MAHRQIGQEQLSLSKTERKSSLDDLASVIDWAPVSALLGSIYEQPKGEAAWPLLAMFRALLLVVWYDLSDVKLAEALDDRASFGRFCGFSTSEPTPERTAFVRFRSVLVSQGLNKQLFALITAQLKARAVTVKTGTLVDATIIASASEGDEDARWVKHKNRRAIHGFKAHVGADADKALVEELDVTPANVNDGKAGFSALPENPGEVFADGAYRGDHFRQAVRARGGTARIIATAMWAVTRKKRWVASTPGTNRSTVCGLASKRYSVCGLASKRHSAPGNAATVFAACDGEVFRKPPPKSISPPSLTTSNEPSKSSMASGSQLQQADDIAVIHGANVVPQAAQPIQIQ